jgi:hypothetical protein
MSYLLVVESPPDEVDVVVHDGKVVLARVSSVN